MVVQDTSKGSFFSFPGEIRNHIASYCRPDIIKLVKKDQLNPEPSASSTPLRPSLAITHLCRELRHDYLPLALKIPLQINADQVENYAHDHHSGDHQDVAATIALEYTDPRLFDILPMLRLASKFPSFNVSLMNIPDLSTSGFDTMLARMISLARENGWQEFIDRTQVRRVMVRNEMRMLHVYTYVLYKIKTRGEINWDHARLATSSRRSVLGMEQSREGQWWGGVIYEHEQVEGGS